MNCASCGVENSPGRKFCGQCGSSLAIACPTCGAPNPAEDKFCGECGSPDGAAPVGAAGRPPTRSPKYSVSSTNAVVLRAEGKVEGATSAAEGLETMAVVGASHQNVKIAFAEALDANMALGRLERVEELLGKIEALRPVEKPPFQGKADEAEPLVAETRETFEQLGVAPWLERVNGALGVDQTAEQAQ